MSGAGSARATIRRPSPDRVTAYAPPWSVPVPGAGKQTVAPGPVARMVPSAVIEPAATASASSHAAARTSGAAELLPPDAIESLSRLSDHPASTITRSAPVAPRASTWPASSR